MINKSNNQKQMNLNTGYPVDSNVEETINWVAQNIQSHKVQIQSYNTDRIEGYRRCD